MITEQEKATINSLIMKDRVIGPAHILIMIHHLENIERKGFFPKYWISNEQDLFDLMKYLYNEAVKK